MITYKNRTCIIHVHVMLHVYHITCGDLNVFFRLEQDLFANMDEWVVLSAHCNEGCTLYSVVSERAMQGGDIHSQEKYDAEDEDRPGMQAGMSRGK